MTDPLTKKLPPIFHCYFVPDDDKDPVYNPEDWYVPSGEPLQVADLGKRKEDIVGVYKLVQIIKIHTEVEVVDL